MSVEIQLREKYRNGGKVRRDSRGNYSGNSGVSAGKHTSHPNVHGYRRNGYKCESKWNPKPSDDE